MKRATIAVLLVTWGIVAAGFGAEADESVIESMDGARFHAPPQKGQIEQVEGKVGKATQFSFAAQNSGVFFTSNIHGAPSWDKADGFSFWVKGDGSDSFGGIEFIYDEDYAVRYDYMFPLKKTDWTKITVAWRDLIPVLPGPNAKPLDPKSGNSPSKLSGLWFGKWWYWGEYPACSFAVDDIRLEAHIDQATTSDAPAEGPLAGVLKKLKAGKPITMVTMGDSLTDTRHWANRTVSWPLLVRDQIKQKYGSDVRIINPAIGGTQLLQNLVLMPRWLAQAPEPDLVTVCFGGNDWEAGMRGPQFEQVTADAIERIRRGTGGKADVLILTTIPSADGWETTAELAEAGRKATASQKSGLADTRAAFIAAGVKDRERLYVSDKVHLGPEGHQIVASTVLKALADAAGDQQKR